MNLVVIPGTTEIHAETFAKALEVEVREDPSGYDAALFVGISPELKEKVESFSGKKIAYWIGSDSLMAVTHMPYRREIPTFDLHWAVHERIQDELKSWSVHSEVVYPCGRYTGGTKKIEHRAIGIYSPTPYHPNDLYKFNECLEIASLCPNETFIFFGSNEPLKIIPENCKDWGRKNPDEIGEVYDHISVLLRLCRHDGFPVGGIEAMQRGIQVIEDWPYPGFLCPLVTDRQGRKGVSFDEIVRLLKDDETHKGCSPQWAAWYQRECHPVTFKKKVESYLENL